MTLSRRTPLKRTAMQRTARRRATLPPVQPATLPANVRPMTGPSEMRQSTKAHAVKSSRLRQSARGEQCTMQVPGTCNCDTTTTVLAHLPSEIAGTKSTDLSAALMCSACHDLTDRRVHCPAFEPDRDWYLRRAMVRTWHRWLALGLIQVKGAA